jgi:RimJ/RimL family protein N-acetyltransferase
MRYIRNENAIVSWSMIDCYYDGRVEIGVHTDYRHRKMGFGITAVLANIRDCFDRGCRSVGWHCVAVNKGSDAVARKAGFRLLGEYSAFSSYPPIENPLDLSENAWAEWGRYLEDASKYELRLLNECLYSYIS